MKADNLNWAETKSLRYTFGNTENSGMILMDMAYGPAAIKYPKDLNLINNARELSEAIINKMR